MSQGLIDRLSPRFPSWFKEDLEEGPFAFVQVVHRGDGDAEGIRLQARVRAKRKTAAGVKEQRSSESLVVGQQLQELAEVEGIGGIVERNRRVGVMLQQLALDLIGMSSMGDKPGLHERFGVVCAADAEQLKGNGPIKVHQGQQKLFRQRNA
ncbi:MAG: hypothetical protein HYS13_17725 [Planctomycetia bacterium]|nr:hypothetical protein [Planctomycetia bacterium]